MVGKYALSFSVRRATITTMKNESMENLRPMNDDERRRETNMMQAALFERWHGFMDENKFVSEWIPKYSKDFREILNAEMQTNPRLFEEWMNPASRDAVLTRFEEALYGEKVEK